MRPRAFLTFLESVGVYSWKAVASWERHRVACWMLSSASVTCPITPRWQLFELYVLQSQDSSSHSTGKLNSQHILCRAFALLRGLGHTVRMENDWIVCGRHGFTVCAVQSHSACETVVLTLFFLMPHRTGLLMVCQKLCVLDWLYCSFAAPLHFSSVGIFCRSHPSSVLLCFEHRAPSRLDPSGVETTATYVTS